MAAVQWRAGDLADELVEFTSPARCGHRAPGAGGSRSRCRRSRSTSDGAASAECRRVGSAAASDRSSRGSATRRNSSKVKSPSMPDTSRIPILSVCIGISGASLYSRRASTPLSRLMGPSHPVARWRAGRFDETDSTPAEAVPSGPRDIDGEICQPVTMSLVAARGPLGADPAGWFVPALPEPRRHRVRRAPPPPDRGPAKGRCRDRHGARADGASQRTRAQLRVSRRRGARSSTRARPRGAWLRARAVGRRRRVVRGGTEAGALPAEPLPPRRLPVDRPTAAGRRRPAPFWSTPPIPSSSSRHPWRQGLYVDPAHVRTDLLQRTDTTSYCNYKGDATYWSAVVGDVTVADVAWSYPNTLPETSPIKGFLSFDETRADVTAVLP